MIYVFFFGFWACQILKDWLILILFSLFFFLYLIFRYQNKAIFFIPFLLLSFFLHLHSIPVATPGAYTIYEIHTNYALARKEKASIVIYGLEDADYYDTIEVSYLEDIESLKNINLFDFSEYMRKEGITKYTNVSNQDIIKKSSSLKAKIHRFFKDKPMALQYFYGIYEEESIDSLYTSLGFGFISFTYLLKALLNRFFDSELSKRIVLFLSILHGTLFTYSASLVRTILSQLSSILFKNQQYRLCFTYFLFLILFPSKTTSFVCVFPFFLQFISVLEKDSVKRKIYTMIFMIGIQLLYFHKVNLFNLVFFDVARKVMGIVYICLLLNMNSVVDFFHNILLYFPKLEISYTPSILFLLLFILLFLRKEKGFIGCILGILIFFESYLSPFFHVYMINIGQGDCTLIVEPYKKSTVLIDCGQNLNRDNVTSIVLPFLKSLQIHKLDAIVVTHEDFDHNGGVQELSEMITVDQIVTKKKENLFHYPFYFLLDDRSFQEENDNSLITYFSYDGFSYLWTGDASVNIEKELIKKYDLSSVDVLKLGHHGSSTSSSLEFLEKCSPKLGLVSVGKHNFYGHPSSEVIGRCHNLGINLLQTKDDGTIHLFSLPHILFFECANGYIGILE